MARRNKKGGAKNEYSRRQRDVESMDMRSTKRLPKNGVDKGQYGPDLTDCKRRGDNDASWYAFNDQLMRDTASFPYSWPLGARLNTGDDIISNSSVPGIMVFYTNFAIGNSLNQMSPVNTAARNIYSYVRHANSGHANYESTDLMLYLLAMDSAYALISFMKRAYGVLSLYAYENRYYNDAILHAMRLDPDDFRRHIADFRAFINTYAVRIGSMCIPNSMSYMARHMWMYQELYLDSNTAKAQTYFYSPNMFFQYGLDSNGLGMLKFTSFARDNTNLWTFKELSQFALDLIAPILSSEDCNIMSGDILKAFGAEGVYKVAGVTEDYQTIPVFNPEVQSQIENITMLGAPVIDTDYDPNVALTSNVYQIVIEDGGVEGTDSYLFSRPAFQLMKEIGNYDVTNTISSKSLSTAPTVLPWDSAWTQDRFVNLHHENVTPGDTMVATRLTNMLERVVEGGAEVPVVNNWSSPTLASDYVSHAAVYWYSYNANTGAIHLTSKTGLATGIFSAYYSPAYSSVQADAEARIQAAESLSAGGITAVNNLLSIISNFDWHPGFYVGKVNLDVLNVVGDLSYGWDSGSGQVTALIPFEDLDFYTIIGKYGLQKMAETALLSMFSVPQMGSFARKI